MESTTFAAFAVFLINFVSQFQLGSGESIDNDYFINNNLELAHFHVKLSALMDGNISEADIIRNQGYKLEIHEVITPDGYVLTLYRIPHGKNGKKNSGNDGRIAYLQHGLLSSSADWILQGPEKSLGYILADEGYDVWMGNARGNTNSRHHTSLDPDTDSMFWQFSWHEIGTIDVPHMIDYALNITGADGVYYVGHSQGTTVFYVMTSMLPEYNGKIKAHISLAPVAFMNHMTSPFLRILAFWRLPIQWLLGVIGINEFLPTSDFLKGIIAEKICNQDSVTQVLCTNTLFAICGFSRKEMNTTLLPIMMHFTPAGAATKQVYHYGQEINSGKFRQYDWGFLGNIKTYGSLFPPNYNLRKITAPVYLLFSRNDWLASEKDVKRLCNGLKSCKGQFLLADHSFNHLDFIYGIDAKTLAYDKVVSLFSRH